MPEGFDQFWAAYPKKVAKGEARKAWAKVKPSAELVAKMLETLAWQVETEQWQRDEGQFIPYPASWLRAERWDDEPVIVTPPKRTGRESITEQNLRGLREDLQVPKFPRRA